MEEMRNAVEDRFRIGRLGQYQNIVLRSLEKLAGDDVIARIWRRDHTVWKPEPPEIKNRLGWLNSVERMTEDIPRIEELSENVRAEGFERILLLGMGGSSLAPEVLSKVFGSGSGYPRLDVLDSTVPEAILSYAGQIDPEHTLFIVSTKSGDTVETLSLFKFFYRWMTDRLGRRGNSGRRFIAITDAGSRLAHLASSLDFRTVFFNDPDIGGRYSALSYFGLVPAALVGVDIRILLERALMMVHNCALCNDRTCSNNEGAYLGAVLGALAGAGRDKLTLVTSPPLAGFGDWVEQLIAESTGKEGRGIVPVIAEPAGAPEVYGGDRLFIRLKLEGFGPDKSTDNFMEELVCAGHPVVEFNLCDLFDLGGQFFLWEMAAAVAGYFLKINPFDQPNVEAAKEASRLLIAEYMEMCAFPPETPALKADGMVVYGDVRSNSPGKALKDFLRRASPGDYAAIQAYIYHTREADEALSELRTRIRDEFRIPVTSGYGPRYLHSTGQLHKGDRGNGLFIQITADSLNDVPIPDDPESTSSFMTFGVLKKAQALGDQQALIRAGRRLVRFHFVSDAVGGIRRLAQSLNKV
ncbi:MAG: glucose-6-phosphate isomerase [Syntrophales bacterium]